MEIVNGWFEDETLRLRTKKEALSEEQLKDPAYCVLHHIRRHNTMDCCVIRKVFHKQVEEGKILLPK